MIDLFIMWTQNEMFNWGKRWYKTCGFYADIVLLNKTIEILCDCCKLSYSTIS